MASWLPWSWDSLATQVSFHELAIKPSSHVWQGSRVVVRILDANSYVGLRALLKSTHRCGLLGGEC